ncbi:hypothetical protein [Erythrobacter colymbi]|uniref:hypothetical protein n=1 Tax=Erythrobacter colymbi TaxID=1161202 RepID=UPI000A382C33|nr:hypothetical protein [Erythrobacter colymbi]
MKHLFLPLVLIAASGCDSVLGPPQTLEEELADAAYFFNTAGTAMLPDEFGKARVEAEVIGKDMLVFRILDLPTGHATIDPATARQKLRPKLCDTSSARDLFARGGKIRMEIISNIGVEATAFQIASC